MVQSEIEPGLARSRVWHSTRRELCDQLGCDILAPTKAMLLSDSVAGSVICRLAAVDRASFGLCSERRCAACSWHVGVPRAMRRNPSSTDVLAGLEALLDRVPRETVRSY